MLRHLDASAAECLVFTAKEGLLSAVAHDLKIRVARFSIDVDDDTRAIAARFDAASLRVVCAMKDGVDTPRTLSADDKREIERNIVRDVLEARDYPEIVFTSSAVQNKGEDYLVKGTLMLHGRQRQITVRVRRQDGSYVAEARVRQPDFGIRPYTALLGTLKVKPDVAVRVRVPAPEAS